MLNAYEKFEKGTLHSIEIILGLKKLKFMKSELDSSLFEIFEIILKLQNGYIKCEK